MWNEELGVVLNGSLSVPLMFLKSGACDSTLFVGLDVWSADEWRADEDGSFKCFRAVACALQVLSKTRIDSTKHGLIQTNSSIIILSALYILPSTFLSMPMSSCIG
jgi:hypothetical protein